MRIRPRCRHGLVSVLAITTLVCAAPLACVGSTQVPPVGAEGAAFSPEEDEEELWEEAREEERTLRQEVDLYDQPFLDDYLNKLAQSLLPAEAQRAGGIEVRVSTIEDPSLCAFTYPTGAIYVHTGLVARMDNEAQLAALLAHEIAHITERHALRYYRSSRNKAIGFSIAALIASIVVEEAAADRAEEGNYSGAFVLSEVGSIMVEFGLQICFLAAVNSYGYRLEREADEVGLRYVVEAGYDPREAPILFRLLQEDYGDGSAIEVFHFGDRSMMARRLEETRELIASRYAGVNSEDRVIDTLSFQTRTRVLVRDDARLNLDAGRLGTARAELTRVLNLSPGDPVVRYLFGQLYEKLAAVADEQAQQEKLNRGALDSYEAAAMIDPFYDEPHRAIGLLSRRAGDREKALAAFRRYLELRPDATDAREIEDYILELEAD